MSRFAAKLLAVADDASLSPDELRAWLRRSAALHIQFDAMTADYRAMINADRARSGEPPIDVDEILDDWAIGRGRPARDEPDEYQGHWSESKEDAHDEDPMTKGSA